MKALVLMFIADDRLDWLKEPYFGHLSRWLSHISEALSGGLILCTDSLALRDRFGNTFLNNQLVEGVAGSDPFYQIARTISACSLQKEEEVVVIDVHNLLVDGSHIAQARTLYRENGRPVAATRRTRGRNHQYVRFHKIITSTSILLFDSGYHLPPELTGHLASKPFRFHWERYLDETPPGIYRRWVSRKGVDFQPVFWETKHQEEEGPLMLLIDSRTARLIFDVDHYGSFAGASLPGPKNFSEITVHRKGHKMELHSPFKEAIFEIVPIGIDGQILGPACTLPTKEGLVRLPFPEENEELAAWTVTVFRPLFQGPPDNGIPFTPDLDLWVFDRSGVHRNKKNGKPITGRQESISLHKITGDLFWGTAGELSNLQRLLEAGNLLSLPFPIFHNRVHTQTDFLHYLAAIQALNEGSDDA